VLLVQRIGQGFEELLITPGAPHILGWTRSLAVCKR